MKAVTYLRSKLRKPASSRYAESRGNSAGSSRGALGGATFSQLTPAHHDAVMSVSFVSPGLVLSGSKDKTIVLYDYKLGVAKEIWRGHEREVTKVQYGHVHGNYFSASRDKEVRMWKTGLKDPAMQFVGHNLVVNGLSLNTDNSQLCTGSRDNSVRLWDVYSGNCIRQNSISRNLVTDVCWGKASHLIAQTGEDKEFRIWDARNLQVCITFPRKLYIQNCCDLSEDNNYAVTCSNGFGGNGCEATLWDLRANKVVCEYKGHRETVGGCCFVPSSLCSGDNLLATCSSDCSLRVWNRDTTECVASMPFGGSGPLTAISIGEDGSICVSSFNVGVSVLRLARTGRGTFDLVAVAQY